ncbi:hypothetical protein V5F72_10710 [Xanthobacter flavus]|uniref:hypothetical protein n=1 Tax=Xanthobacter flavus TaxID=281 RepID=UPI003728182A
MARRALFEIIDAGVPPTPTALLQAALSSRSAPTMACAREAQCVAPDDEHQDKGKMSQISALRFSIAEPCWPAPAQRTLGGPSA